MPSRSVATPFERSQPKMKIRSTFCLVIALPIASLTNVACVASVTASLTDAAVLQPTSVIQTGFSEARAEAMSRVSCARSKRYSGPEVVSSGPRLRGDGYGCVL